MKAPQSARRRSIGEILREYKKSLLITLAAALSFGALSWAGSTIVSYFESRPVTVNLDPKTGQANIARFFEIQIRPEFNRYCARPNWERWIARSIFGQECKRLIFEPHSLENMITRRVPYKETAEPEKLLELFIHHHRGCLDLREDENMILIYEPESASQLQRREGAFICP